MPGGGAGARGTARRQTSRRFRGTRLPALARNTKIVVQELDADVLVYNTDSGRAVRLNATAAAVWRTADGTRTAAQIAQQIAADTRADISVDLVFSALELREKEGLLQTAAVAVPARPKISRRELGVRLGAAALVLLPAVSALTVPASAQVSVPLACQSCIDTSNPGSPCGVCADITGTCFNNNGCSTGGASASMTCTACVTYLFSGQPGNNTWKYDIPV